MFRMSGKQVVVLMVAFVNASFLAEIAIADPLDSKNRAVESKSKPASSVTKSSISTSSPARSISKPVKQVGSAGKFETSKSTDALVEDELSDASSERRRSGKRGKQRRLNKENHRDKEKQGGHRRGDDIPSFRNVRRLESLTAVQESKITHIIREQREKSLPFAERLKEIRDEAGNAEGGGSGRPRRSREASELREKVHAIKKDAWLKMQRVLTVKQKIELEAHRHDDPGPRRKDPNAQPSTHDSGRSFSQ